MEQENTWLYIEGAVRMSESARIMGLALTPQISRNGTLYTIGQLKHGDGVSVPLNIEHGAHPEFGTREVGEAVFSYDSEHEQLNYTAVITDPAAENWARNKILHVSIEARGRGSRRVCNEGHDCFDMPSGLEFTALALTENPGIMSSTVSFLESTKSASSTYIPLTISGGMAAKSDAFKTPKGMFHVESMDTYVRSTPDALKKFLEDFGSRLRDGERKSIEAILKENSTDVAMDDAAQVATDTVSDGEDGKQKDLDGDYVPAHNQTVTEKKKKENDDDTDKKDDDDKEESKSKAKENDDDTDKKDDDDKDESKSETWIPNMDELRKTVEEAVARQSGKIDIQKEIHNHLYKKERAALPEVSRGSSSFGRVYEEAKPHLARYGRYAYNLVMDNKVMESYGGSAKDAIDLDFKEAVTFSGGTAGGAAGNIAGQRVHADSRVIVDPAGLQTTAIRDLVRFTEVAVGDTEVVFQITDANQGRLLTEGSANPNQTDEFVNVVLDNFPAFGHTQSINRSTFENSYTGTLDAIAEKAAIASIHREAEVVFRDVANGVASPTNWINGNGDDITGDDSTTAVGTLSAEAIGKAESLLRTRGYSGMNGEEFCIAVTPRQLNDLRNDPDIDRWMQYSKDGERTTHGTVPMIHGVRVVPMLAMGAVNANNNRKERAVVFIKNYSFLLGAKRELQISMLDNPNRFALDWSWSKRIDSKIYKEQSIVRISTDGRT